MYTEGCIFIYIFYTFIKIGVRRIALRLSYVLPNGRPKCYYYYYYVDNDDDEDDSKLSLYSSSTLSFALWCDKVDDEADDEEEEDEEEEEEDKRSNTSNRARLRTTRIT
uniref:Uncharacterized protein n=1 Tax=Lygus hesperus TaxID=30085 RepID=A0A146M8P6_LYGHE